MKKYFAMINGQQCGPYELSELADAGVGPDTYVWAKGMPDWTLAREDADICREFRRRLLGMAHPGTMGADEAKSPEKQAESDADNIPVRFRRFVSDSDVDGFDNEPEPDTSVPPKSLLLPAVIVTLLCCPLTGFIALYQAWNTQKLWQQGKNKEAYEAHRLAKMWIGITFFLGIILNVIAYQFLRR